MSKSNRSRGVIVYPLKKEIYDDQFWGDKYAVGINPHTSEVFMIHNPEGVGYVINSAKPWKFYDRVPDAKSYTLEEILNWMDLSNPIDLADLIRTFGSRLESNFSIMHWYLTNDTPMQDKFSNTDVQIVATFKAKNKI